MNVTVSNKPKGQETITLTIDQLSTILGYHVRTKDTETVSIEFCGSPDSEDDKPVVRFVSWNVDQYGNESINGVHTIENIPCPIQARNECDDLKQEIGIHEDNEDRYEEQLCAGIDNLPKEHRWSFIKAFNPDLTIRQAEKLVEDPLHIRKFIVGYGTGPKSK